MQEKNSLYPKISTVNHMLSTRYNPDTRTGAALVDFY